MQCTGQVTVHIQCEPGSTCSLLHASFFLLGLLINLKMEAVYSPETSVEFYWVTQHYVSQNCVGRSSGSWWWCTHTGGPSMTCPFVETSIGQILLFVGQYSATSSVVYQATNSQSALFPWQYRQGQSYMRRYAQCLCIDFLSCGSLLSVTACYFCEHTKVFMFHRVLFSAATSLVDDSDSELEIWGFLSSKQ